MTTDAGEADPALEIEDLRIDVAASGHDIVDEVSLTIAPGEVLGLVGESGSGKTTVGLAVLGHARKGARIATGTVEIGGFPMLGARRRPTAAHPRGARQLRAAGPENGAQPRAAHRAADHGGARGP